MMTASTDGNAAATEHNTVGLASAVPKGDKTIHELPGRICENKCTWCKQDLSFVLEGIKARKIDPPDFCPLCGKPLSPNGMTRMVKVCGVCGETILEPAKELYCRHCGRRLNYGRS